MVLPPGQLEPLPQGCNLFCDPQMGGRGGAPESHDRGVPGFREDGYLPQRVGDLMRGGVLDPSVTTMRG
ncbi:MAG: hypothetical protein CM15mP25_0300 [Gammaproteobacteria bacterium]|nr:MAG: hypothetical protein CM15mP25_0300 [Gammaproteobacteria bacterium]